MAARLVEQDRDTAPLYEIASELAKVENSIRAALDNPKTAVHDFLLIPADLSTPKASRRSWSSPLTQQKLTMSQLYRPSSPVHALCMHSRTSEN